MSLEGNHTRRASVQPAAGAPAAPAPAPAAPPAAGGAAAEGLGPVPEEAAAAAAAEPEGEEQRVQVYPVEEREMRGKDHEWQGGRLGWSSRPRG